MKRSILYYLTIAMGSFLLMSFAPIAENYNSERATEAQRSEQTSDSLSVITELAHQCTVLEAQYAKLRRQLTTTKKHVTDLATLSQTLLNTTTAQRATIDSLRATCNSLEVQLQQDGAQVTQKMEEVDRNINSNKALLHQRSLWGIVIAIVLIGAVVGIAYWLARRVKRSSSSIEEIRKAQHAVEAAQQRMAEESVKLDNQLLQLVEKQLETTAAGVAGSGEPDHSLVVKLADEIARIETNLSKMDKSVRGYKQLVQAKDRMINNVRANGYEIISLIGQEYNDGMQFKARMVPDDTLPEGKRIITGMIKMLVNYNGKMIQPAEIVVSQNI
ncbi:MAG: hypothetical protein SOW36_01220 [Porphyromonas sp.]|uniref:hypothetical protein n=1 Tax=Porphyromonas sp. TaxID=1924944 RepID=UPI002A764A1D|nr:hypothetical protein [Porphyromonas sp.]MDD6927690.1 hypothetical protein [Bacteroidales bacterium]MDY3111248.1 hypothetical protein [Porphyromonas sp.]MDY4245295.1 hypothetical protein [Porphyromonas sp.]